MLSANEKRVLAAAADVSDRMGADPNHTVAAAAMDTFGRIHTGKNVYHFTGGPCAELVVLGAAVTVDAGPLTIMVAVANEGRGVIAPCGRCRQAIVDLHPDCVIIVPGPDGPESMPVAELLPFAFRHPDGAADRVVRFDDSRYDPVEQGLITATIRYRDPVDVGPALFIFDNDDGYRRLPGLIESVEAVPLEALSPEHARRGGASSVEHLRQGLARRHPGISGRDVVDFVRFQVRGS